MKKVLIIAFEFPPLGSGGVIRCTKYVKYLREYGWEPVILTIEEDADVGGAKDYSLLSELPGDLEIHRTPYRDLDLLFNQEVQSSSLLQMVHSIDSCFPGLFSFAKPDKNITWFPKAFETAKHIVGKGDIDLVYTDSPPNSTALIGHKLKEIYGIPWVADFRDPWSLNDFAYESLGDRYHPRGVEIDKLLEKIIMEKCDALLVVSHKLKDRYINELGCDENQICVFNDGYDEEDFKDITRDPANNKEGFKIGYMGSFYGSYNPTAFLKALSGLITKHGVSDICFHVIGHGSNWIRKHLDRLGLKHLEQYIKLEGHMEQKRCLSKMMENDLLLVISPEDITYNVPQKIYSYMRMGLPIFALLPEKGEAAGIINETRSGIVINPKNPDQITEALHKLYLDWKQGTTHLKTDFARIEKYEKRHITDKLSSLFNKLCDDRDQNIKDFNQKGERFFNEGRYEDALTAFKEALERNPTSSETLNNIGVVLTTLQIHDEALDFFEKAIQSDPLHKDALINAYQLHSSLNNTKKAEDILNTIRTHYGDIEGL